MSICAAAQSVHSQERSAGCGKWNGWVRGSVLAVGGLLMSPVDVDSILMSAKPVMVLCWNGDRMLHLKPGVNPHHIQPEITVLIQIVSSVFVKHGYDCIVTSLYDDAPNRKLTSFHRRDGLCRAVDFKTVHLPETIRDLMFDEIREAVGYGSSQPRAFDFIFESRITSPDGTIVKEQHWHGEYDTKFPLEQPKAV